MRSAVLALVLAASPAFAAPGLRITGRSLATVRVDGGRDRGLKVGDRLRVVEGDAVVAEVEVVFLDARSAACRVVSQKRPIGKGDLVVPVGVPVANAAGAAASAPKASSPDPRSTGPWLAALRSESGPAPVPPPAPKVEPAEPRPAPAAAPAFRATSTVEQVPPAAEGRRFRVKYRSATSVYLDGGRADGLEVGHRLRVVAGGSPVGEIEVVYVAEQSASCRVLSESRPVRAGDEAVSLAAPSPSPEPARAAVPAAPAQGAPPVVAPATATPTARGPWARVRGAATLGYYRSWDRTDSGLDYQQRTARLDLRVDQIAGEPLSFTLRARSRLDLRARTLSTRTPQSERTDRLYEVGLRYEPPSDRVGLEAGRIGIYRFVGVGYLDGALARYRPRGGVQLGLFGGRVADIEGLGWNGTGSKYGAFVRLAPPGRYTAGGYEATLAWVRENADGDVSREYLSLESFLGGGARWSFTERAELDLNRGWRKGATGRAYQLSNVSLAGNLRLAPSSWVVVSYDGRRNYRYYQNRIVPEEVFDDLLHQGLRAALTVARPSGFGASAGFGMSLKEKDPRHPELDVANAYSFNAGLRANVFGSGLSAGVDGSGFSNGYADGGLLTTRLGWRARAGHLVDLSYGYSRYRVRDLEQDRRTQWLRLVGRAELVRRLYLSGDFEYDTGDDLKGPRFFLEVGVFF
jgi:hypothetical protein